MKSADIEKTIFGSCQDSDGFDIYRLLPDDCHETFARGVSGDKVMTRIFAEAKRLKLAEFDLKSWPKTKTFELAGNEYRVKS